MFSEMIPHSWTEGARFCYQRGCNCRGCYVKDIMDTKCYMKSAVIKLVEMFGAPKEKSAYTQTEKAVIKAILKGANTKAEIAQVGNIPLSSINFTNIYEIARTQGFYPSNQRHILPEYIEWLRWNEDKLDFPSGNV